MELNQAGELSPGTSVWVWVVRLGKGKWWPGTVTRVSASRPFPIIHARFECRLTGKNGADGAAFIGISTTRMRYLELRNPDLKGADQPDFVPASILARPEGLGADLTEMSEPPATNSTDQTPRLTPATRVKKVRSERKEASDDAISPTLGK